MDTGWVHRIGERGLPFLDQRVWIYLSCLVGTARPHAEIIGQPEDSSKPETETIKLVVSTAHYCVWVRCHFSGPHRTSLVLIPTASSVQRRENTVQKRRTPNYL